MNKNILILITLLWLFTITGTAKIISVHDPIHAHYFTDDFGFNSSNGGNTTYYNTTYINNTVNGYNGINGTNLTMISVTDNGNYTYTWCYSDGNCSTTSNLRGATGASGSQGIQGIQGIPGVNGTNGINGINGSMSINTTQMDNSTGVLNILESWLYSLFYTKSESDIRGNSTYMKIENVSSCDPITQKYVWNSTTKYWNCETDRFGNGTGGGTANITNITSEYWIEGEDGKQNFTLSIPYRQNSTEVYINGIKKMNTINYNESILYNSVNISTTLILNDAVEIKYVEV